jgi:hypothetical protein
MTKYRYHKDHTEPRNGEVFVFGSNLAGIHGAGAARLAEQRYGAVRGSGIGLCDRSYAIPTKDSQIHTLSLKAIKGFIAPFMRTVKIMPGTCFFMTRVGCGLAGYKDSDIAPMFKGCPDNVIFPEEWKEFLED